MRKSKTRYNNELLQKYFLENNINSTTDYSDVNLNREYRIKEKCVKCDDLCNKDFRSFINFGCYCKKHTTQNKTNKMKATCLEKYGCENPLQSQEIRDKTKATNLERFGVENASQSQDIREKAKETCLKKYGGENPSCSQEVRSKRQATCLERFGFKHALQSQEIKNKMKKTTLERFGVEHANQSQEIRTKTKATFLEKYGCKNPLQLQEIRDKIKATNLERLGVEYPTQSQEVRSKFKATCLKKYGVEHPMQNAELSEQGSKNAYKAYDYIFPSGRTERIQGYEKYMLNDLLFKENVKENDIIVSRNVVPIIWYEDVDGKKRRYFVDCFIKSQNRCIEVKSTWTAKKKQDIIYLKQQALKDAGYLCEIWIYNKKGEIVEKIL